MGLIWAISWISTALKPGMEFKLQMWPLQICLGHSSKSRKMTKITSKFKGGHVTKALK